MLGAIYIAAVDEGEAFDPLEHNRKDLDYTGVEIIKNDELSVWSAEITVRNPQGGVFNKLGGKVRIHISQEIEGELRLVFTGRIEVWPMGPVGREVVITALGRPLNVEAVEATVLSTVNDDPYNLFSEIGSARTSDIVLAARHAALNWRRDDGLPQLVDMVSGLGYLDIGQRYIEGTLNLETLSTGLSRIDVVVKAQWDQAYLKGLNIAQAFGNNGKFGTISPPDLNDYPRVGSKIGDWTVMRSIVQLASADGVPDESEEFNAESTKNRKLSPSSAAFHVVRFKRKFFQMVLNVAAVLTARRTETLRFSVVWAGQQVAGYVGGVEEMPIDVRNLDVRADVPDFQTGAFYSEGSRFQADGLRWEVNSAFVGGATIWSNFDDISPVVVEGTALGGPTATQFFGAPNVISAELPNGNTQFWVRNPNPGLTAIRYAYNRARAKLIDSNRFVRATFEVPWPFVSELQGCEIIRIADPEIPGGEMFGKVVSMRVDLMRGVASVTIAASPGYGQEYGLPGKPAYFNPILDTFGIVRADIVNTYEDQEQFISQNQYPQKKDLVAIAEANPTRLEIELSGVPKGGDLSVDLPIGTYYVDTPMQILIGAR